METSTSRPILRSLQPIGMGTPEAESAESYVWRLADAHGVPWQTLHKFINGHGPAIYGNLRGQLPRLDAPTPQAAAYMRRVADLVGRPDVESLGLSWLAGWLRAQHVLRANRAWCCACLTEMKTGRMPYTPMIWSLASVSHCARHGARLQQHCRACGAESSIRRALRDDRVKCTACGHSLTAASGEIDEPPSMLQVAVLEQMGLLVSITAIAGPGVGMPEIAEIVTALHRRGHRVNPSEMARRMGVSKGTISSLMSGRAQAGIDLLLRLSTAYGLRLPDLLMKQGSDEGWLQQAVRHDQVVWPARTKPRIDWTLAQRTLDLEMNADTALSVARIAKRIGIDGRHLAMQRTDCAAALATRHRAAAEHARERGRERVLALIQAIDDGASQRAVARSIGVSRSSCRFREVWR